MDARCGPQPGHGAQAGRCAGLHAGRARGCRPDLAALRTDFDLKAAPDKDGLQWVEATPKAKDGQLSSVRVGLKPGDKGPELAALEIADSFGQRSVLRFSQVEVNPALPATTFQFKPPAGADVLRQ